MPDPIFDLQVTRVYADGDVELSAHYGPGRVPKGADSTVWFDRLDKESVQLRLRKLPKVSGRGV